MFTSIFSSHQDNRLQVYPNPFYDYVAIIIPEDFLNKKIQFELYSVSVQLIKSVEIENTSEINLGLSPSIYFYRILNDKTVLATGKIMKE